MLVKLTRNIGTADAKRLSLPATREGDEVEVPEKVAAEMIKNGWAAEASAAPKKIHAVPPVDLKSEVKHDSKVDPKPIPGK